VGTNSHLDLQGYWTDLHWTCFAYRGRNRCRTSNSPILNIFIRSGDICRQTSNSTEIRPNFACFWPLKIFWGGSPKILDRNYKNWMQHRASCKISRRSADGARRLRSKKKEKKNKPQQNI